MSSHRPKADVDSAEAAAARKHKTEKWSGKNGKKPSVKNVIRSLKRLLSKSDLPEAVRVAKQAQLDRLEQKSTQSALVRKEHTIASRYHKVKFFERRKIERRIKQWERKLLLVRGGAGVNDDGGDDSDDHEDDEDNDGDHQNHGGDAALVSVDECETQLRKWKGDLDYVTLYPKGLKYVALFPKAQSAEAQAHSDAQRTQIHALIVQAKALSTSAGVLLAAAGKLSGGGARIDPTAVASAAEPPSSDFTKAAARFKSLAASFVSSGMHIPEDDDDDDDENDGADTEKVANGVSGHRTSSHAARGNDRRHRARYDADDGELVRRTRASASQGDAATAADDVEDDDFFLAADEDTSSVGGGGGAHKRKREDSSSSSHDRHEDAVSAWRGRGGGSMGGPRTFNRSFGAASKFLQHDKSDREERGSGGFQRGGRGGRGGHGGGSNHQRGRGGGGAGHTGRGRGGGGGGGHFRVKY